MKAVCHGVSLRLPDQWRVHSTTCCGMMTTIGAFQKTAGEGSNEELCPYIRFLCLGFGVQVLLEVTVQGMVGALVVLEILGMVVVRLEEVLGRWIGGCTPPGTR